MTNDEEYKLGVRTGTLMRRVATLTEIRRVLLEKIDGKLEKLASKKNENFTGMSHAEWAWSMNKRIETLAAQARDLAEIITEHQEEIQNNHDRIRAYRVARRLNSDRRDSQIKAPPSKFLQLYNE